MGEASKAEVALAEAEESHLKKLASSDFPTFLVKVVAHLLEISYVLFPVLNFSARFDNSW